MIALLIVLLVSAIVALLAALAALFFVFKTRVPFVRTPTASFETIIAALPKQPGIKIADLGCGDGSILFAVEQARPDAKLVGYELAPAPYLLARWKRWLKKSRIQLYYRDFNKSDLSSCDVVFCFLIASVMPKLETKLREELKPGALVISYGFTFPTWQPERSLPNPDPKRKSKIHIYRQT